MAVSSITSADRPQVYNDNAGDLRLIQRTSQPKAIRIGQNDDIVVTNTGDVSIPNGDLSVTNGTVTATAFASTELAADPADPAEGANIRWQSNGTGSGDDGDIMLKITAGGVTKTITLVDFSTF